MNGDCCLVCMLFFFCLYFVLCKAEEKVNEKHPQKSNCTFFCYLNFIMIAINQIDDWFECLLLKANPYLDQ